ncbi:hypothetical protein FA95DRAFT_1612650 [Auriscalpium vulgare]|uniref:Uncharacterized protein n=1 Tax=Auriscalpium vulgare TaxID=40419 RepID=A0ACB8R5C1_9AGAM|nr:hypothetical protein FA95DRAFT_1612650 [Auriscalpium vulgare]
MQDKKCRKNAKPKSINTIANTHEDYELSDFLLTIISSVERQDLLESSRLYLESCNSLAGDAESFSVLYSITGTGSRDLKLNSVPSYNQMLKDVHAGNEPAGEGNNTEGSKEEEDNAGRKKSKKHEPSEKEIAQDELIVELSAIHACNDHKCNSACCFISRPDAEHVKLTSRHLRTWSAGIHCKKEGVDNHTPPTGPLFDLERHATNASATNIATLANHRLRTMSGTSSSSPNINVSFAGLADVVAALKGPERVPLVPTNVNAGSGLAASTRVALALPPRLPLATFCAVYELSAGTASKLQAMDLVGPHVLCKLTNQDLQDDGMLSKAQVAEVRDAEERWLNENMV